MRNEMNTTNTNGMEHRGTFADDEAAMSTRAAATQHRALVNRGKRVGMFSQQMEITPEYAAMVLAQFAPEGTNRTVSRRNVDYLARQMREGRWNGGSHQGVAFRADGVLADGQHRLTACVEAGQPFLTMATFGQPDNVFSVLDQGVQRTASDLLQFAGLDVPNRNNVAALARFLLILQRSNKTSFSDMARAFDKALIIPFVRANTEDLCDAVRHARNVAAGMKCKAPITGIGAAFYFIGRAAKSDPIEEFADGLALGASLARDNPILALREAIRTDGAAQGYRGSDERNRALSASVIMAWNFWRSGRPVKSFRLLAFNRDAEFPRARA